MKRGFTLIEVMVTAVVLSIGAAGIGHIVVGFVQAKEREAKKGVALVEAVSLIEEQVATPGNCVEPKRDETDTSLVILPVSRQGINFTLSFERIPGGAPLQWASVHETSGRWDNLTLKRIVRCVETDSP
ncbi:MAG: type II secretion system protein [Fibrobacter sp.]|nr:type II secretion system protein [Fibrobacter sp.]